jgi:hypothetical protein
MSSGIDGAARPARAERHPELLAVELHPARAHAELEPSLGQHGEGGGLSGQQRGVLHVVVLDQGPNPQRRPRRGVGERDGGRELRCRVHGDQEGPEAGVVHPAHQLEPGISGVCALGENAEPKSTHKRLTS